MGLMVWFALANYEMQPPRVGLVFLALIISVGGPALMALFWMRSHLFALI